MPTQNTMCVFLFIVIEYNNYYWYIPFGGTCSISATVLTAVLIPSILFLERHDRHYIKYKFNYVYLSQ